MSGINLGTAFLNIVPSMQGIGGEVSQGLEREAGDSGGKAGKAFAVAAGAAVAASVAIAAGLKAAYDVGSVFDDVADTIRVGTGKSGAALEELNAVAKSVATTVPASFESAGATVTALSQQLGLSGEALTTVSSQFLEAGRILGQDVDVKAATGALNVFGVTSDQISTKMDELFRVSQSTGVGMNELTAAATAQAPALQELGFGFTDTVSIIGSLEKAGINSGAVTASMSKGLVKLAKDGEQPAQAYQRITGQLGDLVKSGKNAEAINLASGIFGTKGATQFIGAIQSGTLDMDALGAVAAGTGDTILGLAAETNDAAESWTLFKNKAMAAFEPIGTAVFGFVGGAMATLAESFDDVLAAGKLLFTGDFQGGIFGLSEDSPAIGALFTIRDTVSSLFEAGKLLFSGDFGGGIFGLSEDDPFIGFLFDLRDVGLGVFDDLVGIWDKLWGLGEKLWPSISSIAKSFYEAWQTINDSGWSVFAIVWDGIGLAIDAVVAIVENAVIPAFDWLAGFFRDNPEQVLILVAALGAWKAVTLAQIALTWGVTAAQKAYTLGQWLLNAAMNANPIGIVIAALAGLTAGLVWAYNNVDWFREGINTAWEVIKTATTVLWDQFLKPFFVSIGDAVTGVIGFFSNFGANVQAIFGAIGGWIGEAFTAVLAWFMNMPGAIWGAIQTFLGTVTGWGAEFLGWLWDGIKTKAVEVFDWFLAMPGYLWGAVSAAAATVGQYGWDFITWIWQGSDGNGGIKGGAVAIFDFFKGLPGMIMDILIGIGSKIADIGKSIVAWIVSGVQAVASTIWDAITAALTGEESTLSAGEGPLPTTGPNKLGKKDGGLVGSQYRGQADGGGVQRYPNGFISGPGGPRDDTVPTWLSAGEYVVNAKSTAMFGPELEMMNAAGRMADGGKVGTMQRATALGGELAWAKANEAIEAYKAAPPAVGSNGNWGPGVSGGFAANTAAAKAYIESHFGGVSSIGGLYGGSVPGSDHPAGKALDVMIANYRSAAGIAAGDAIADWFQSNPSAFGTKYEIWRKQYRKPGEPWGPYSHPSGSNDTLDHNDHVHISFLTGGGEFAGGQPAADDKPEGAFGSILGKLRNKFGAASPAGAAFNASAGVEQWRALSLQALAATGEDASNIGALLHQMQTESGGDPNAVNNWDSNARRGTPSKGLLQVIQPTFEAALRNTSWANLIPKGPTDPWANIISSILYARGRYGSLQNAYKGRAYATGGIVPGEPTGTDTSPAWLTPGEAVLTQPEREAYQLHAQNLAQGFGGVRVVFEGDEALVDLVRNYARVEVDNGFDEFERTLTLTGAQAQ